MIFLGIGILLITWRDFTSDDADLFLFSNWLPFSFNRWQNPILFWAIILAQVTLGLALIVLDPNIF